MRPRKVLIAALLAAASGGCAASIALTEDGPRPVALSTGALLVQAGEAGGSAWWWIPPGADPQLAYAAAPDLPPWVEGRRARANGELVSRSVPQGTDPGGRWLRTGGRGWTWAASAAQAASGGDGAPGRGDDLPPDDGAFTRAPSVVHPRVTLPPVAPVRSGVQPR